MNHRLNNLKYTNIIPLYSIGARVLGHIYLNSDNYIIYVRYTNRTGGNRFHSYGYPYSIKRYLAETGFTLNKS